MEAQRRRLAILSSHLCPTNAPSHTSSSSSSSLEATPSECFLSPSNCDSRDKSNQETDCIFCKIVRGESSSLKLYEDDVCLCILDKSPVSHGHSLIIPRCHYPSLAATPPSVVAAMCAKVPYISNAIMKAIGCDSFNLLVNNGVAAGQVVFHLGLVTWRVQTHIHIIPRNARDCLWASESLRRRPLKLDQDVLHLVDSIRDHLSFPENFEDNKDQGSSVIGS